MNVGFISLGCSKNLVDTEIMIGIFKKQKYAIVSDPKQADIIVINTCGFIESAKEEAINTILEMAEYKKKRCKVLIVTGCLVERYKEQLEKSLPEVDLWIKFSEYNDMSKQLEKVLANKFGPKGSDTFGSIENYMNRVITTGTKTAYLRVAEGCSNHCTYCAIPSIRGPFQSRKIEDVLEEANYLAQEGYEEIIVIAQDTTKYGIDLYGKSKLAELLQKLEKIKKIRWIRFLYAYPEMITDELIEGVKNSHKICHYFDIPLQHISNSVLKKMNRKSDEQSIKQLIQKIRKEIPDVVLRTSLIVGFPGETEEDFQKLYDFVKETKFNRLGVFPYSKEEGTPAERLPNQIHGNTKKARYGKIMKLQQMISNELLEKEIGKEVEVLVESLTFDHQYWIGRTKMDVPEMDGVVYIQNTLQQDLRNQFIKCKIIDRREYDLIAKIE